MKRILTILLAACLLASATACSPADNSSSSPSGSQVQQERPDSIYIMDAAIFRGTVTLMEKNDEGVLLTLEPYPGTSQERQRQFLMPDTVEADASFSFAQDELVKGVYLEVFYGVSPDGSSEEIPLVIGANLYPDAAQVNLNGVVLSVHRDEKDSSKNYLLVKDENGQEVQVKLFDDVSYYLDAQKIKQGDRLNIFTTGIATLSDPPQVTAREIRPYTSPNENIQLPNPMLEVENAAVIKEKLGIQLTIPAEAADPAFSIINGSLGQVSFKWQGISYTLRAAQGDEHISGVYDISDENPRALPLKNGVSVKVESTASGGQVATWQDGESHFSLYTSEAVPTETFDKLLGEVSVVQADK